MTDETPMKKGVGEGECYCIENARCHHHAPRDGQLVAKWDGRPVSDDETAGEGPSAHVCSKSGRPMGEWFIGPCEACEAESRSGREVFNAVQAQVDQLCAQVRSLTERAERAEAALAGEPDEAVKRMAIRTATDAALGAALRAALATVPEGWQLALSRNPFGFAADVERVNYEDDSQQKNDETRTLAALLRSSPQRTETP